MRQGKRIYPNLFKIYSHQNWIYLFHALIILLISYPYIEKTESIKALWLLSFFNSLVVLAIIYEVSFSKIEFGIALLIGIPIFILYWFPGSSTIKFIQILLHTLLYLYAIFMILTVIIPQVTATAKTIFGTISLYILIGLCWANIYQIIAHFKPDAFVFSDFRAAQTLDWSDYLYYSFVTLTTLGYGDIIPVAPQARSAAILEAMTGVLFIAVMVSKTIGLYVGELRSRKIIKD